MGILGTAVFEGKEFDETVNEQTWGKQWNPDDTRVLSRVLRARHFRDQDIKDVNIRKYAVLRGGYDHRNRTIYPYATRLQGKLQKQVWVSDDLVMKENQRMLTSIDV
jgi:hypothetical protein